jgi:anti-anti-sigma factor
MNREMHLDGSDDSQRRDQSWVIELIGEHDVSTAPILAEWTAEIDDSAQLVELDLRQAEFIDSAVVGAMAGLAADLARAGRELVIVSRAGTLPRRVLDLVGAPGMPRVVGKPHEVHVRNRHREASSWP